MQPSGRAPRPRLTSTAAASKVEPFAESMERRRNTCRTVGATVPASLAETWLRAVWGALNNV